jgi:hypothetical protein
MMRRASSWPSSGSTSRTAACGLSLLLESGTRELEAEASWGEYRREVDEQGLEDAETPIAVDVREQSEPRKPGHQRHAWRREPRREPFGIELPDGGTPALKVQVPNSDGLEVSVLVRSTKVPMYCTPFSKRRVREWRG